MAFHINIWCRYKCRTTKEGIPLQSKCTGAWVYQHPRLSKSDCLYEVGLCWWHRLVQWVVSHGRKQACRAVYLHVIAYNNAAIGLYRKNGFSELAMRPGFYYIGWGSSIKLCFMLPLDALNARNSVCIIPEGRAILFPH